MASNSGIYAPSHFDSDDFPDSYSEDISPIYSGMCRNLLPKEMNFDEVWPKLYCVLTAILEKRPVPKQDWDMSFTHVYNLCSALPSSLAGRLYDEVDKVINVHVLNILKSIESKTDNDFMNYLVDEHNNTVKVAKVFNDVFSHLNSYTLHETREHQLDGIMAEVGFQYHVERHHIGDLVMRRWRERVLMVCAEKVIAILFNSLNAYRETKSLKDVDLLRKCIDCYIDQNPSSIYGAPPRPSFRGPKYPTLELYRGVIEKPLEGFCVLYYQSKRSEWANLKECTEYVEKVASLIEDELTIAKILLHETTLDLMEAWAANTIVSEKVEKMQLTFKAHMTLENFHGHELNRCFNVLKLINNGLNEMIKEFVEYAREYIIQKLNGEASDPKVFVTVIANATEHLMSCISATFNKHDSFIGATNEALRKIVNDSSLATSKAGDRIARYADSLLRKTNKDGFDDAQMSSIVSVLNFLSDKESFEKPYQILLATRLLGRMSCGVDTELTMIELMKGLLSGDVVMKMNRMCADMVKNVQEVAKFFESYKKPVDSHYPMEIMVLQTGSWPLQVGTETYGPYYPYDVITTTHAFATFYSDQHTGRTITWAPSLSTVDVKLNYTKKSYTVSMTSIHFDIICCFENVNSLTVEEICNRATLTMEGLKRYLKSLIENQILLMPKNEFSPSTVVSLNLNLERRSNRIRLAIPMTNKAVKQDIRPEISSSQSSERCSIECVIVRVLKQQKTIKHVHLVDEVIKALKQRFSPSVVLIKTAVESLIERGFLRRQDGAMDEYEYIV